MVFPWHIWVSCEREPHKDEFYGTHFNLNVDWTHCQFYNVVREPVFEHPSLSSPILSGLVFMRKGVKKQQGCFVRTHQSCTCSTTCGSASWISSTEGEAGKQTRHVKIKAIWFNQCTVHKVSKNNTVKNPFNCRWLYCRWAKWCLGDPNIIWHKFLLGDTVYIHLAYGNEAMKWWIMMINYSWKNNSIGMPQLPLVRN